MNDKYIEEGGPLPTECSNKSNIRNRKSNNLDRGAGHGSSSVLKRLCWFVKQIIWVGLD